LAFGGAPAAIAAPVSWKEVSAREEGQAVVGRRPPAGAAARATSRVEPLSSQKTAASRELYVMEINCKRATLP